MADAFRAGRSRQHILEILSDSRIGTYAALALILTCLLRWQALVQIHSHPWAKISAACALSRGSIVALGAIAQPAGRGLGASFIESLTRTRVSLTIFIAAGIAIALVQVTGLFMLLLTTLTVLAARTYFHRRLGGVNGDCLGATCVAVETLNLLLLAANLPSVT